MIALGTSSDLLTMAEVAARLHVSRRWLQDFLKTRPHGRMAGRQTGLSNRINPLCGGG